MNIRFVCSSLAACFLASFSFAKTINVPAQQPTIQAGINAAQTGDTVLVAPGKYIENINFIGKAITVKSSNGPKVTIIDGNAAGPVVLFTTNEGLASVLSGFTLQHGNGNSLGAGVSILDASPTITNNIVWKNTGGNGGGIGVAGSPIIRGNTITQNSAVFGGGVDISGDSHAQLLHNIISSNTVNGAGAGVELFTATNAVIEDNKIVNNVSQGQGGGLWIVNESDEMIVQNLIAKNVGTSGSQIYLETRGTSAFTLINNTIVSATNGGADAAVFADGNNSNAVIENNVIFAAGDNAALLCNPVYAGGPPIVKFNDAFNPLVPYGDTCSGFDGTNGNISDDPLFISKTNYKLQATSPDINAGSNSAPNLPAKDLANKPRIVGGTVDMGTYEFQ